VLPTWGGKGEATAAWLFMTHPFSARDRIRLRCKKIAISLLNEE
jgi:hypothetical protein